MAEDLDFGVDAWQDTCRAILSREKVGLDDMTELEKVNDRSIADNLHIRLMNQQIYVSPFSKLLTYLSHVTFHISELQNMDCCVMMCMIDYLL